MPRKTVDSPKNSQPLGRSPRWERTVAAAVFLAVAAPVLAHLLFTPKFQENDDAYMNMIACGAGICDRPDPHLLFINFLIGKLLTWLYNECPGAPWYRLFMITSQFGASLLLYMVLLRDCPTRGRFFLCLCYMLGFDVFAYANPQFTVTASMVMQAGVLAYIAGLGSGRLPLGAFTFLAASALSCCIRKDSFKLILVMSAPALAVTILEGLLARSTQSRSRAAMAAQLAKSALPIAISCLFFVVLDQINQAAYRSGGWDQFYEYNNEKTSMIDFKYLTYNGATKSIFDRLGWSENDYKMFCYWGFVDETTFSIEKLKAINAYYRSMQPDSIPIDPTTVPGYDVGAAVGPLEALLRANYASRYQFALLSLALCLLSRSRQRILVAAVSVGSFAATILLLTMMLHRCPFRVSFSAVCWLTSLLIWTSSADRARGFLPLAFVRLSLMGLVAVLCISYLAESAQVSGLRRKQLQAYEQTIMQLKGFGRPLIVDWAGALRCELLHPWGGAESVRGMQILLLGTPIRTPLFRNRLREMGIQDIFKALYTRGDVFITLPSASHLEVLKTYIREHYGDSVRILGQWFFPSPRPAGADFQIALVKLGGA